MKLEGASVWEAVVGGRIFRGGNSIVYEVRRAGDESLYAAKVFNRDADEQSLSRFNNEIILVKGLVDIKGCVSYIDHGMIEEKPFYIMPLMENGTFRTKYITNTSSIDIVQIIDDFSAILVTVASIHDLGLAIRDIKPQNILLDVEGRPVIADFGLSMWADTPDDERQTRIEEAIGSQGYRPPEWHTKYPNPNHRSGDIWSLGRTLWAMVARENAPNNYETLGGAGNHLKNYLPKEQALILQGLITSCTSQEPEGRPPIGELIDMCADVRKQILELSNPPSQRQTLQDMLKKFSQSVENSDVYIDMGRRESERNILVQELDETVGSLIEILQERAKYINEHTPKGIGNCRVLSRGEGDPFLEKKDLRFKPVDNEALKRYLALRFDYSASIMQHTGARYAHLYFYIGFTQSGKFFWVVQLSDYPGKKSEILDSLEVRSLTTVAGQKVMQINQFIQRFLETIQSHF
ncbi:hypothetical protein CSQ93_24695 [Janthinobacterium sp. BJB426]|uniref:serine/threonine protein kinase n=1 Tax=Janthinobacterium sp. BJB426 TaxID=2048010 RepID=UPI000C1091C2|nr:protein kinase [Janthinobacterium sp. BJB426]PHV25317.1 hypothetical protein CSQ93_24695 [Janthinobacterium sp. BJB426]